MQAEVEINKKKEEVKSNMKDSYTETEAKQKLLQNVLSNNADLVKARQGDLLQNYKNSLDNSKQDK
jgi:hypothetical protein